MSEDPSCSYICIYIYRTAVCLVSSRHCPRPCRRPTEAASTDVSGLACPLSFIGRVPQPARTGDFVRGHVHAYARRRHDSRLAAQEPRRREGLSACWSLAFLLAAQKMKSRFFNVVPDDARSQCTLLQFAVSSYKRITRLTLPSEKGHVK